jgi:hypothetical protein
MNINTASGKRDAIHDYLAASEKAANWYKTEHNVTAADFTAANVKTYGYGPDAMGELADLIIGDAIADGFLTEEDE